MRTRSLLAIALALAALAGWAAPVAAQVPPNTSPAEACAKARPTEVFVGEVVAIHGGDVTYQVQAVGTGDEKPASEVRVEYPTEYNAALLHATDDYKVSATMTGKRLLSVVPTATLTACGQVTQHADGSTIDTSALAGVKQQLPRDVERLVLGIVGVLVLLILLGRVFDRRSRYN